MNLETTPDRSSTAVGLAQHDANNDAGNAVILAGWSNEDERAAGAQGWNIFDIGSPQSPRFDIQTCDDSGVFASDAQALVFVYSQAMAGQTLHQRALRMVLVNAPNYAPPKVGVDISGGAIHGTWATEPVDLYMVDYDDESDYDELVQVPQPDGSLADAYLYRTRITKNVQAEFDRLDAAVPYSEEN